MKQQLLTFLFKFKKQIIIVCVLLFGTVIFIKLFNNEKKLLQTNTTLDKDNYDYYNLDVKDDTLSKFGFCAKENYVITEDADVRRTPNKAMYNSVYKLKFGTKVYTKNLDENTTVDSVNESYLEREKRNKFVAIYAIKPILLSEKPVGYIHVDDIIEKSLFQNYKPKEKKIIPIKIESAIKSTIESNLFINEIEFEFSKDIQRFNNSLIYGDFNNDQIEDFAIVLDNIDKTSSVLQIYFNNPVENSYTLAYKKIYPSLLKIKFIKKESDVLVNSEITKFPLDGVLIINPDLNSLFNIYNTENKTFMVLPN